MAAHPLGRHVAHSSPQIGFAVKAISGGSGELGVAAHDEDLAPQDRRRRVAPRLGAFGCDVPAVSQGVVVLHLDTEGTGSLGCLAELLLCKC